MTLSMLKMNYSLRLLLFIYVVNGEEPILDGLYGIQGGNKVTVCVGGRGCKGAIWMNNWVVARQSCLGGGDNVALNIWRGDVKCSSVSQEKLAYRNMAVGRYKTSYLDDISLLQLNWPYPKTDPVTNQTANSDIYKKLQLCVNEINKHIFKGDRSTNSQYYSNQYLKINSSPIKMFLVTVVLPSAAFMVFFFFIIFFTGSNKNKVSYRPLVNEPDGSHI